MPLRAGVQVVPAKTMTAALGLFEPDQESQTSLALIRVTIGRPAREASPVLSVLKDRQDGDNKRALRWTAELVIGSIGFASEAISTLLLASRLVVNEFDLRRESAGQ